MQKVGTKDYKIRVNSSHITLYISQSLRHIMRVHGRWKRLLKHPYVLKFAKSKDWERERRILHKDYVTKLKVLIQFYVAQIIHAFHPKFKLIFFNFYFDKFSIGPF